MKYSSLLILIANILFVSLYVISGGCAGGCNTNADEEESAATLDDNESVDDDSSGEQKHTGESCTSWEDCFGTGYVCLFTSDECVGACFVSGSDLGNDSGVCADVCEKADDCPQGYFCSPDCNNAQPRYCIPDGNEKFFECPPNTDDDDDDNTNDDVWTDSSTGLMWQNSDDQGYTWDAAKSCCENLLLGGYNDWRLPSISELRSLVRECSATATDGPCDVTDTCLDHENCWSSECEGCSWGNPPGPDGQYWPSELQGDGWWYWSSSLATDTFDSKWFLDFKDAQINTFNGSASFTGVRCVR